MDKRNKTLAHNLVNYSCDVQEGEKVLIEATTGSEDLVVELVKEIYAKKAYPFVSISNIFIKKEILRGMDKTEAELMAKYMSPQMSDMDCYIGIRGSDNIFELSNINPKNVETFSKYYSKPIHHDIRVNKTKWVILGYPTSAFAQQAGKSSEEFCDFFYNVCNLDYSKMDKAMDNLKALMDRTDRVRIVSPNTDLSFSIKDIPAIKCSGKMNIPDGEVYTAPVKNSVNGKITYNAGTMYNGLRFDNVCLEFKDGKIINATSSNTKALNEILDTDDGARFVGEFAIGVNPYVNEPMLDILFDEKISGSIHFTPGACYQDAYNGNVSAVHWDLVLIQTEEHGGGEIYFDDVLIRKNGRFVIDELLPLNPENLK